MHSWSRKNAEIGGQQESKNLHARSVSRKNAFDEATDEVVQTKI